MKAERLKDRGVNGEKPEILMRSKYKRGGSNREEGLKELEVMSRHGVLEMEILERERNRGRQQGQGVAAGEAQRRRRDEVTAS